MRISVNTGNKFSTFGSTQPNTNNLNANQYRYGFGGMEQDKQTGSYTTYFRQYDPRIARWKSTDPVTQPWQSPYTAFDNNPIFYTDPSGAIAIPNKRRGIGAGGSIGGIGGALAGSAQTALSLAIRSGIQASMVGTYMQSAILPTSSATNSGRELGVGKSESNSTNNSGAKRKNNLKLHENVSNEVNQRLSSTTQKQNSGDATPGPRDKRIGGMSGATPYAVSQQWGFPYHPQNVTKTSELFEVKNGTYLIVNPRNNDDKMVLLNNQGLQISEIRPFKSDNSYKFDLQPFIDNGSLLNNQFYLQVTPLEFLSIYSIDIYEPYTPSMPSFR